MAHEQLKFKLHLEDTKEWQPILGDQHLNTFYMVYVKFSEVNEEEDTESGSSVCTYKCQFRIQNFRGAVTFGFCAAPEIKWSDGSDKEVGTNIILNLCAFKCNDLTNELTYQLDKPIDRNKYLETISNIYIEEGFINETEPIKSNFLDPLKYRRDGDVAVELGQKMNDDSDKPRKFEPISGLKLIGTSGFVPGLGICSPKFSILI
jgi:hypothetical protein